MSETPDLSALPTATGPATFGPSVEHDDGLAVVQLSGELSATNGLGVRNRLVALLLEHRCMLLDLNGLRVQRISALDVFSESLDDAGGWPEACLALFTQDRTVRDALHTSGVTEYLWVAATADLACARSLERPPQVRGRWTSPPAITAPSRLRTLIHRRWLRWHVPEDVAADALLVVNELVSNAVDHAGTTMGVQVGYDGSMLHIEVRDGSSDTPRLQPHDVHAPRGRGLQMVAALTTGWGWTAHDHGKTVWASVAGPPAGDGSTVTTYRDGHRLPR